MTQPVTATYWLIIDPTVANPAYMMNGEGSYLRLGSKVIVKDEGCEVCGNGRYVLTSQRKSDRHSRSFVMVGVGAFPTLEAAKVRLTELIEARTKKMSAELEALGTLAQLVDTYSEEGS